MIATVGEQGEIKVIEPYRFADGCNLCHVYLSDCRHDPDARLSVRAPGRRPGHHQ
jgi:hypothetical protein